MKKNFILTVLVLVLVVFTPPVLKGEKKAVLHELINPEHLQVANRQFYVTQGTEVFIYSLANFKLQKKFGKQGEGPGEFLPFPLPTRSSLRLVICPNQLVISSVGKLSFFSLQGEFKKEKRSKATIGRFKPVGNYFTGFNFEIENNTNFIAVNLYDDEMNKIKQVYRFLHFHQNNSYVDVVLAGVDYFDKVYTRQKKIIISGDDDCLHVFDHQGNPLKKIALKVKPARITDAHKTSYHEFYRTDPRFKSAYEMYRHQASFNEYFPLFRRIFFDREKIIIVTFNRKPGISETIFTDIEGKLYKKEYLPIREQNIRDLFPLDIKKGKIYQLLENKEEKWELHITDIRFLP